MLKGLMNSLHLIRKEGRASMLKTYIAANNKVRDFFEDKRAVSHLLEVVGVLALAALILVVVFPGARGVINSVWDRMVYHVSRVLGEEPGNLTVPAAPTQ